MPRAKGSKRLVFSLKIADQGEVVMSYFNRCVRWKDNRCADAGYAYTSAGARARAVPCRDRCFVCAAALV